MSHKHHELDAIEPCEECGLRNREIWILQKNGVHNRKQANELYLLGDLQAIKGIGDKTVFALTDETVTEKEFG